jgi:hypothetical protein
MINNRWEMDQFQSVVAVSDATPGCTSASSLLLAQLIRGDSEQGGRVWSGPSLAIGSTSHDNGIASMKIASDILYTVATYLVHTSYSLNVLLKNTRSNVVRPDVGEYVMRANINQMGID